MNESSEISPKLKIASSLRSLVLAAGLVTVAERGQANEGLRPRTEIPRSCAVGATSKCTSDLRVRLDGLGMYARNNGIQGDIPHFDSRKTSRERCTLTMKWFQKNIDKLLEVALFIEREYPGRQKTKKVQFHYKNIQELLPSIRERVGENNAQTVASCGYIVTGLYWLVQKKIEGAIVDEIQVVIAMLRGRLGATQGEAEKIAQLYLMMLNDALPKQ